MSDFGAFPTEPRRNSNELREGTVIARYLAVDTTKALVATGKKLSAQSYAARFRAQSLAGWAFSSRNLWFALAVL